ncbi:MAG: ChaN family lipoprotein [Planctomycetota bacterium]|nr:ChaN family lipoprotein [Planctomycetota bacterium]
MRSVKVASLVVLSLALAGCVRTRCCPQPVAAAPAAPDAPLPPTARRIYRGDGAPMRTSRLHQRVAAADVILFGELHGNAAGSKLQLEMLEQIAASGRPFALAMEFFERDVQADLDRYLADEIDEATFLERTRQSKAYPTSHRPLVELCKARGAPIIAANAPRPLVRAFRKTEDDYDTFKAGLSEAERASLPRTTSRPDDVYKKRFMDLMGPKRGPSFFRAQALWDDAMAEAVEDFRTANPDHIVLLIVGAFHVGGEGGTLTKIRTRRPGDRLFSLILTPAADDTLAFDPEAKGAADAVVMVRLKPRKITMPNPHPKTPKKADA